MGLELTDVLIVCTKAEGKTAPHYLLGYLWASIPKEKQEEIYTSLARKVNYEPSIRAI